MNTQALKNKVKAGFIALALGLFSFRFVLLATALVIPQSLSFRGLDPAQFAPAVVWTAVPAVWVPRTVSPSLIRAIPAGGPDHLGSGPAQHDRQLWPSDSPT